MTWTNESLAIHFDKLVNLILTRMAEMQAQWERATDLAREMARQEIPDLEARQQELARQLHLLLLPNGGLTVVSAAV